MQTNCVFSFLAKCRPTNFEVGADAQRPLLRIPDLLLPQHPPNCVVQATLLALRQDVTQPEPRGWQMSEPIHHTLLDPPFVRTGDDALRSVSYELFMSAESSI